MKIFKLLMLSLFVSTMFIACVDDDNDALTGGASEGGLVNVNNPLLSFVVGSGATYTATGSLLQGRVQTTGIDVYKKFTTVTGETSNRELLTSISISDTSMGSLVQWSVNFTFEQLREGLTVNGAALPTDDGQLNIGDFWTLEYEGKTSTGDSNNNSNTTKVAVSTRYAGIYTVVDSAYWNSGNLLGNWNGGDRIIESVDAVIYRHVGLAYWDDNEFFFEVDNSTNYITVYDVDLADDDLLLNGSPAMTCEVLDGYNWESLTCDATTSVAIPNDVTGEDELKFTVGYFRGVGATREFFEHLVKQVD